MSKTINFNSIDNLKLNFKHTREIKNGNDFEKEFKSIFSQFDLINVAKNDVLSDPFFKDSKDNSLILIDYAKSKWSYFKYFILSILILIGIIFVIFSLIYCKSIRNIFYTHKKCTDLQKQANCFRIKKRKNEFELKSMKNWPTINDLNNISIISDEKLDSCDTLNKITQELDNLNVNKKSISNSPIILELKNNINRVKLEEDSDFDSFTPSKIYKDENYSSIKNKSSHAYQNDSLINVGNLYKKYDVSLHYNKGRLEN
jgi:hypothetical protein